VWWIEKRISVEREMACDDVVLAETANPHGYAACLVSLLEKSLAHRLAQRLTDKRWAMAQAAVHRAREASLRLAQILDKNRPAATRVWKPALGMVGAFSVACLMALPHAPQFVAFDRGAPTSHSDPVSLAAVSQSSFGPLLPPAAIVPAGFQTHGSQSARATNRGTTAKVVHARVNTDTVAEQQIAPARVVATGSSAAPPRERVVEASASADQEVVPQFRTLVFIEATQYGNSDSAVWSVQVWRVTVMRTVHNTLVEVPVANSI
jgi:hypothetical protein